MAQIHFSLKDDFDKKVKEVADKLGLDKSDYIKSLITEDIKKYLLRK